MTKSPDKGGGKSWSVGDVAGQHLQQAKGEAHNSIKEVQAQYGFRVQLERGTAKSGRADDKTLNALAPMRVMRLSNTPRKMRKKIPKLLIVLSIAVIILTLIVMAVALSS